MKLTPSSEKTDLCFRFGESLRGQKQITDLEARSKPIKALQTRHFYQPYRMRQGTRGLDSSPVTASNSLCGLRKFQKLCLPERDLKPPPSAMLILQGKLRPTASHQNTKPGGAGSAQALGYPDSYTGAGSSASAPSVRASVMPLTINLRRYVNCEALRKCTTRRGGGPPS